jgi:hypothetical protein
MSEFDAVPLFTFKTRTNTELGAQSVSVSDDGTIVFHDILKIVTESMLTSYPRSQLGTWTPNRAAIRFTQEELSARDPKDFKTGKALDVSGLIALAG